MDARERMASAGGDDAGPRGGVLMTSATARRSGAILLSAMMFASLAAVTAAAPASARAARTISGVAPEGTACGGKGPDDLDGGYRHDVCRPGPAADPHAGCEDVPPVTPRNLAIAFSDLDGNHRYGPGDVLISRLFDTNGDGIPSKGDTDAGPRGYPDVIQAQSESPSKPSVPIHSVRGQRTGDQGFIDVVVYP
jgi:hypothetical protein